MKTSSAIRKAFQLALVLSAACTSSYATPLELYVATTGSDTSGSGTLASPWKTIGKARDYIRTNSLNSAMTDDIHVNIGAGDYPVTAAIAFGVSDSGSNGYNIIYRNGAETGSARLVGAAAIGSWTVYSGNIWEATIATGWTFNEIWENNKWGWKARTPNRNPNPAKVIFYGDYLRSESGGANTIVYKSGDLNPTGWTVGAGAEICWWVDTSTENWGLAPAAISNLDSTSRTITFATQESAAGADERYFIQGIFQLLDAPGEFYVDSSGGHLYYYPQDGNPNQQVIMAPHVQKIINVAGSLVGTQAHNLQFVGLSFYGTDFAQGTGTVTLTHANNISILNCHFKNVGAEGVMMVDDCSNNAVTGCWIENTGEGGVVLQNSLNRTTYPSGVSDSNSVTDSRINDYGKYRTQQWYSAGVLFWCTSNSTASNLEIYDSGRYGISLRGNYSTQSSPADLGTQPAYNNTFSDINMHDLGTDSGDMGGLHAAACNPNSGPNINFWNQIVIANVAAVVPSMDDILPNGVFLDHPCSCENQDLENINVTWMPLTSPVTPQFRTNHNTHQTTSNVSWDTPFSDALIDYANIGLTSSFPDEYNSSKTTVIVDDHQANYTETGADWIDSTIGGSYHGLARYNASNSVSESATWTPYLATAGSYRVWVRKFDTNAGSSTAANYTINYSGGSQTVSVNQQSPSDEWQLLGTYSFATGNTGNVVLTADGGAGAAVRADAVKFSLVGNSPGPIGDEVAWWPLDGSGLDWSQNNLHLTNNGGTFTTSAKVGSEAYHLDPTYSEYGEALTSSYLDSRAGDFAISLWFYRETNAAGNLRVLSKGAGFDGDAGYAIWGSDTQVSVAFGSASSTRTIVTANHSGVNAWTHLVVNFSRSGNMTVYINGSGSPTSASISALSGVDITSTRNLDIGRNVSSGSQFWPGTVDDVRIFKRTLTAAEIDSLDNP